MVSLVENEMKDTNRANDEGSLMYKLLERGKKLEERQPIEEYEENNNESELKNKINEDLDEDAIKIREATNLEKNLAKLDEEEWTHEDNQLGRMVKFLRGRVLIPLKNHMFETKKNDDSKEKKLRVFLTIAVVKVLHINNKYI